MHLTFDINILGFWSDLILFDFCFCFCFYFSETSFHKSPFFSSIFFLWLIDPADQCHSQYIINYILPDQTWWTGDYSCGSSDWMLLANLWLCGTAKNEAELKGDCQVGINPNSNFDNGHSCDLRNFPHFLSSSPKRARKQKLHLPTLFLSWHPQPLKNSICRGKSVGSACNTCSFQRFVCWVLISLSAMLCSD